MKRKLTTLLLFALLLGCTMLSGCTLHNKTLDPLMQKVVTALNHQDIDSLRSLVHPEITDEAFEAGMAEIMDIWQVMDPAEAKLVQLNFQKSAGRSVTQGIYLLKETPDYNVMQLIYEKTDGAGYLISLRLAQAEIGFPMNLDQPLGIASLVLLVLSLLIMIVTIVDIVRKKPLKYGWFIVLALIILPFTVSGLAIALPVGALLYWCLRKSLMKKKAAKLATEAVPEPEINE